MAQDHTPPRSAYRHLFTWASDGALGAPGFQTIACASELRSDLAAVESLVRGYRSPDRDGGGRTRLVMPLPADARFCALASIVPTGRCGDGRAGNYWAETLVVPARWLAAAGWDVDAAFEKLKWWGPEAAARIGDWPHALPAERLAPLNPGPLDRLARLAEALPADTFEEIVSALVRQTRGREPIFLLEAAGAEAAVLESLVTLLPLTLPPPARVRVRDGQRECLRLRTRGRPGEEPAADVQGLPSTALDEAKSVRGLVVDLGGRRRNRPAPEATGSVYARWLREVLEAGDWPRLEAYYEETAAEGGGDPFARFAEGSPPPSRAEPGGDTAASEAWRQRNALWEAREEAERESWELRRRFEDDLRQLREEVGRQIAASEQRHAAEMKRRAEEARNAVVEAAQAAKDEIGKSERLLVENLRKEGQEVQRRVVRRLEADLRRAHGEAGTADRGGYAAAPTWVARLRRSRAFRVVLASLVIAVLGYLVWVFGLAWWRGPEVAQGGPPPPSPPGREEVYDAVLSRLRDGSTAAGFLRRAAQLEPVKDRAAAAWLALALGQREVDEVTGCALVQTAVNVGRESPIKVDGDCGRGTVDALNAAAQGTCCAGLAWSDARSRSPLAACFLERHLSPDDPDVGCTGTAWTLRRDRAWKLEEGERALGLLRRASRETQNDNVRAALAAFDPATDPAAAQSVAGAALTESGARLVLELAHLVASGESAVKPAAELGRAELEKVLAELNE